MPNLFERASGAWEVLRGIAHAVRQPQAGAFPMRIGSPPDQSDEDLRVISSSYEYYRHYTHLEPDRLSVYSDMDELFSYVLAYSAMDAYIEDALQPDPRTGRTLWARSDNPEVQAEIMRLFDNLEMEDRIEGDFWGLGKYGDHFGLLMYDTPRGVFDYMPIEPRIVTRNENKRRVLKGFTVGGDASSDPGGDKNRQHTTWKPWDMVHWRLRGKRASVDPYGTPFFLSVRLIYKVLKLMEEQMTIYRMNMHPDRLIFKIFTGSMGTEERRRVVRLWRSEMERLVSRDHQTGRFTSEYAPPLITGNIYWPVGQNDNVSGVEKFPGCFTGDTKISLLSGEEVPIKDLVDRDEFWVYSFGSDGSFYPGRGHSARLTKKNAPVVKVTLDTGETIRCTPDHRFMLKDGTYKHAEHLTPNDSLMPLYRKLDKHGYEQLASNRRYEKKRPLHCSLCGEDGHNKRTCGRVPSPNWVHTHRLASLENEGCRVPAGYVIHHADFNSRNNSPENLIRMTTKDHDSLHAEHLHRSFHSPDAKRKAADATRRRYADSDWREKKRIQQQNTINKLWGNDEFVTKALRNLNSQTSGELSSNAQKANHERWHVRRGKKSDSCALCMRNHRAVSVEPDGYEDVYDITVDTHHNFSLTAGVVVHNSANAGDCFDVEYMRDLFFAGVRIPKAYVGLEDSQGYRGTDTLSAQSMKFARGVQKLRRGGLQGLTRLVRIHLALRGIDSTQPQNTFTLEMVPVSYLDEAHKTELTAKRMEALDYMISLGERMSASMQINTRVWAQHVLKEFGGLDDSFLMKLLTPDSSEQGHLAYEPTAAALRFEDDAKQIIAKRVKDGGKTDLDEDDLKRIRDVIYSDDTLREAVQHLIVDAPLNYASRWSSEQDRKPIHGLQEAMRKDSSLETNYSSLEEAQNASAQARKDVQRKAKERLTNELHTIAQSAQEAGREAGIL